MFPENVQMYKQHITLKEFNEGVVFRIWLMHVQLYLVKQEDSQGWFYNNIHNFQAYGANC